MRGGIPAEGRPEGRLGVPPLTVSAPACRVARATTPEDAPLMSPTRPERQEDSVQAPASPDREPLAPRSTPVTGAADVEARLEVHLAQCRRRGGVLSLLCVRVEAMASAHGEVSG